MPILGRSNPTHKQTALFDIRLKGAEHDVLVIKGASNDAPSVLLSGTIVLSVLEPMSIKKLTLKLYATLRLKWTNVYETQRGTKIKKPYRFERRVFEHNWDNFEIQHYFSNLYDNYNSAKPIESREQSSANSSSGSLKSIGSKRSKSSSNLVSFGSSASFTQQNSTILLQGNYEFPFSAILPGSTLESVEGLPGASLVYKLQANIERGRFANDLIAKKHLRIVRTMTPDAIELAETMAVDNTWPKKVEYSISIPTRAVPIGSSSHVSMLFVPLAKGLKLGKIKIYLVEYYSCCGSYGPPHSGDRSICEIEVPAAHITETDDRWKVETLLNVPPSLSKCTQDLDVLTNIKVRHKLKFTVGLINPDGHVSELRASLPIILFISPFVTIGVKNYDRKDSISDSSLSAFADIPSDGEDDKHEAIEDDDVIFAVDPETLPSTLGSQENIHETNNDIIAPPNYENHIYDRLWSEFSVENTPEGSRTQTPVPGTPNGLASSNTNGSVDDSKSLGELTENLRQLHIQRLNEQNSNSLDSLASHSQSPPAGATQNNAIRPSFTIGDDDDDDENDFQPSSFTYQATPTNELGAQENDYFSINPTHRSQVISPGITPGYNHLSRANSSEILNTPSSVKDWNAETLSQVPSYKQALRSPTFDDFSPAYIPPVDDIVKPKSIHLKGSSLSNSRHQSTAYLSTLRGGEHASSYDNNHSASTSHLRTTSPSISRAASSTNLPSSLILSKSPSKSHFGSPASHGSSPMLQTRSTSFVNLMGNLMHKKDRKK